MYLFSKTKFRKAYKMDYYISFNRDLSRKEIYLNQGKELGFGSVCFLDAILNRGKWFIEQGL